MEFFVFCSRLESSIDLSKWFISRKGGILIRNKYSIFFTGRLISTKGILISLGGMHQGIEPRFNTIFINRARSNFLRITFPSSTRSTLERTSPTFSSPLLQDGILHFRFVSRPSNYPLSTMLSTQTPAKQRRPQKEDEYNRIGEKTGERLIES